MSINLQKIKIFSIIYCISNFKFYKFILIHINTLLNNFRIPKNSILGSLNQQNIIYRLPIINICNKNIYKLSTCRGGTRHLFLGGKIMAKNFSMGQIYICILLLYIWIFHNTFIIGIVILVYQLLKAFSLII